LVSFRMGFVAYCDAFRVELDAEEKSVFVFDGFDFAAWGVSDQVKACVFEAVF